MSGKKLKALIALTVCGCLLLSQAVMAESASVSDYEEGLIVKYQLELPAVPASVIKTDPAEITTKISMDEAKEIVKSFKFTEGYEIGNVYLDDANSLGQAVWRMDLLTRAPQYISSNMQVSISADTGELVSFNSWQNSRKNIVTLTRKQAQEIADEFIDRYVENGTKKLELIPNTYVPYEKTGGIYEIPVYDFMYELKVNGNISSQITYNLTVNAANGSINSFYSPNIYKSGIIYPPADDVKDLAQLKNRYTELLNMQLQYINTYENNISKTYLAYVPTTSGLLNAITLEPYKDPNSGISQPVKDNQIVPEARVENKEITESEAQKIIDGTRLYLENLTGIKFEDMQNNVINLSDKKEFNKYYSFHSEIKNCGFNITLNLLTGNITNLSYYQYGINGSKPAAAEKVSYKDAKKVSDDIIKNLFKKQYGLFSDNNKEPDDSQQYLGQNMDHHFTYFRFVNGINTNNLIDVSINKETGELSQIYMNWSDYDFPKPDNIISAEQAKEIYLKDAQFRLAYFTPYIIENDTLKLAGESIITYQPDNVTISRLINAETGEIIDLLGNQQRYFDENHWAADSIDMLETQGIVLNNLKTFDDRLKRQDAVKMLALALGIQYFNTPANAKDSFPDVKKENEYYRYIESAVLNGIIKADGNNFDGEQLITKKEFVVMLLDMLGYREMIDHRELFAAAGDDIYVSICKSFDILPVKPGAVFNSEDKLTFAEAAYSLQKALKYIR